MTGAFKIRGGAYNKMSQLSVEEKARGVVAAQQATMPKA